MNELNERIIELEIRYSYHANMIEELNTELTNANLRIDRLEREAKVMRGMLGDLQPEIQQSPDE